MKTQHKMWIARLIAIALSARSRPHRQVLRHGINWILDIREAIDLLIFLVGHFQRRVVSEVVRSLPYSDGAFIDVGCNRGAIALAVARQKPDRSVVAIDAVPKVIDQLKTGLAINQQIRNIQVYCTFLNAGDDGIDVKVPTYVDASWNVFHSVSDATSSCATPLAASTEHPMTLDELIDIAGVRPVSVIKVDVDGYELSVLRGATRVLRAQSPTLVMEWARSSILSRSQQPEELARFLDAEGYVPKKLRLFSKQPRPISWERLLNYRLGSSCELVLKKELK